MKGKIESAKSGREEEKRKTLEHAKVRKDKQKRRQQTRKDPFRKTGREVQVNLRRRKTFSQSPSK